jgi:hypothetical protein
MQKAGVIEARTSHPAFINLTTPEHSVTRINWNKLSKQDQFSRSAAAVVRFERDHFAAPPSVAEGSYAVRAKYASECACGGEIRPNDRAWYYPNGPKLRKILCEACGTHDAHGRVRSWKDRG